MGRTCQHGEPIHLAVQSTLVGALREGEVAGLTPEDLDFEGADGTGTFRINKCMQRVQKASLAKTGKGQHVELRIARG